MYDGITTSLRILRCGNMGSEGSKQIFKFFGTFTKENGGECQQYGQTTLIYFLIVYFE